MNKDEITNWALANGWRMVAGCPSLNKSSKVESSIVRLVLKTTVVHVEVKKPAGKWERLTGAAYGKVEPDPDTGIPRGLGLVSIPGFTQLMQENRDRMVFSNFGS